MQPEWLNDDVLSAYDTREAGQQLGAVGGGVVGKLNAVAVVTLEDLQGEAVVPCE